MTVAATELPAAPDSLRPGEGGVVRVGASRVALDTVIGQYENGMSPEDMVRAYDTLRLADVYEAIAYYLRHRGEVDDYLARRGAARRSPPCGTRSKRAARASLGPTD